MRAITLLVGENSTGKTTFLGCYGVMHRLLSSRRPLGDRLDFNQEPFSMGSFRDIVRSQRGRAGRIDEFTIGFNITSVYRKRTPPYIVRVSFSEEGSQPIISSVHYEFNENSFMSLRRGKDPDKLIFETEEFEVNFDLPLDKHWTYFLDDLSRNGGESFWEDSSEEQRASKYISALLRIDKKTGRRRRYGEFWSHPFSQLIPVAPLRSKPKRTYDPIRETDSPEGEHIPMLMMRLNQTDAGRWGKLHDGLVAFGQAAGLFSDIAVRRHGKQMSDPFQLQIKVRSGSRANIMDVGYGVSQSLPILVDAHSRQRCTFVMQQPEVHLHPRAQAELATLFVESANKRNNQFIIETHSDYIIDRIRILTKKGLANPEDVSILYFAPQGSSVEIHNIHLDENGNLQNVPQGYRDFFVKESDRLLGFED